MKTDQAIQEWAQFVASKFERNHDGWEYSRDVGDLEHIRYKSDHTGYQHWTKRVKRAFNWRMLTGRDRLSKQLGFKWSILGAWTWIRVSLRKDTNTPDGVINSGSIITFWEEDGEYITLFGPTVGMKVLEFLKAEPEHPHAVAIMAELRNNAENGFPTAEEEEQE